MSLNWKNWMITAAAGVAMALVAALLASGVAFAQDHENTAPVAFDDTAETPVNTAVVIAVLANDTDDDDDALIVTNLGTPANGSVAPNNDGTVTYTPAEDFTGEDSFTYTAYDGVTDSNQATVTVTVTEDEEDEEDAPSGIREGFVGALQGDLESGLTLVLKSTGEEMPLTIPEGFDNIKTPGGPRAGELADGAELVVLAEQDADGNWFVKMIVVKPAKPARPVTGVVTQVNDDGTFTITTPNGRTHTVRRGNGDEPPGEGVLLTLFPDVDLDGDENGGEPPIVRGLVRAADVRASLQRYLNDANDDADDDEGGDVDDPSAQGRARRAAVLANLLADHDDRRVATLDAAIAQAGSDTARAAIERAKTRAQDARGNAQAAITTARDRAAARGGRPDDAGAGTGGRPDSTGGRPDNTGQGTGGRPDDAGQGRGPGQN